MTLTKNKIDQLAALAGEQERERTVFSLQVQADAKAMHTRHADERKALAAKLGVPLGSDVDQAGERTSPVVPGAAAAAPVVQNGKARR